MKQLFCSSSRPDSHNTSTDNLISCPIHAHDTLQYNKLIQREANRDQLTQLLIAKNKNVKKETKTIKLSILLTAETGLIDN